MNSSLRSLFAALALLPIPAAAQGLPAGASALNETYGDWRISCSRSEAAPICSLTQTQLSNDERRQLVLAVELNSVDDAGTVTGILVLPFGLDLDGGIALSIDEESAVEARFSTCLPTGCLVPLRFDADMVARLSRGTSLAIQASVHESEQQASFAVGLNGLAAALTRLKQIKGP